MEFGISKKVVYKTYKVSKAFFLMVKDLCLAMLKVTVIHECRIQSQPVLMHFTNGTSKFMINQWQGWLPEGKTFT